MKTLKKLFDLKDNRNLKAVFYVLFLDFVYTFSDWINQGYLSVQSVQDNTAVCWPYFKSCTSLYVFDSLPFGYSLNILYMVLGLFLFVSLYYAYVENWNRALMYLIVPTIFKFFMIYMFSYLVVGNFNIISLFLALFLIFSKDKLHSLKVLFTLFYLCAAFIKINPGYISGDIFASLKLGVPLLPDYFLNYYGVLFLLILLVLPILLWSTNLKVRLFSISILTIFHIYSIALVGYRYPVLCIPILWLLFFFAEHQKFETKRLIKDYFAFVIILLLIISQIIPIMIKGDERITSEGEKYGFYMFTANRQCVREINVYYKDGTQKENVYKEYRGMRRCDPYEDWYRIQNTCKQEKVKSVKWSFNVSVNGSNFYNLVSAENACGLKDYKPFEHNDWIDLTGKQDKNLPVYKNSI